VVAANSTVYIDPTVPSLPLSAVLVPSTGAQLSGQVAWLISYTYIGPGTANYSCSESRTLAANLSWSPVQWCGGQVTLSGVYNGVTYPLSFIVGGTNPPLNTTVQTQIGPSPWYAKQLARSESNDLQFLPNGQPVFGAPNGFGIMQMDYGNTVFQLWNWKTNVAGGLSYMNANQILAPGPNHFGASLNAWNAYQQLIKSQIPMHQNATEGSKPCVFSYTPAAGQYPFTDGIAIKMYNVGLDPEKDFMYWDSTIPLSTPMWLLQDFYGGFNYVSRVCSAQP
jgi:hypothetical protein